MKNAHLAAAILVLLFLVSCSNSIKEPIDSNGMDNNIEQTIHKELISQLNSEVKLPEIVYSKDTELGLFSYFTFFSSGTKFEGIVSFNDSEGTTVRKLAYGEIDEKIPVTRIQLSITNNDSEVRMIGGQINNPVISSILLSFFNGTLVKVYKFDSNSYAYVDTDNSGGLSQIQGFNEEDELIFEN
ncbi:hypothetical protein [Paenibacillus sp. NPDC057967]|uniref:hypothetical protein n=1 Tax=Paenibacillus sp. NPDC057967 TaxID=3346293 RepID=UPI0036DB9A24